MRSAICEMSLTGMLVGNALTGMLVGNALTGMLVGNALTGMLVGNAHPTVYLQIMIDSRHHRT